MRKLLNFQQQFQTKKRDYEKSGEVSPAAQKALFSQCTNEGSALGVNKWTLAMTNVVSSLR